MVYLITTIHVPQRFEIYAAKSAHQVWKARQRAQGKLGKSGYMNWVCLGCGRYGGARGGRVL